MKNAIWTKRFLGRVFWCGLYLLAWALFTPLALATEQLRDLVEYEGEIYQLENFLGNPPPRRTPMWIFPLEEYDEKTSGEDYISELYPEHGEGGTSLCWRNYVGKYLIKDNKFYLDKLIPFAVYWDKEMSLDDIPKAQRDRHYQDFVRTTPGLPLERINPQWKSPVFAEWFSGKVCLKAKGSELVITIKQGKIIPPILNQKSPTNRRVASR